MGKGTEVDLKEYVPAYLSANPECEVHIGSDSQNLGRTTIYVTAVVFRFEGHGAHVLYTRERLPAIRDLWTKLWGEVERSLILAEYFTNDLGCAVRQIDLDYNSDDSFASHKVLSAASGYVQSMGYVAKAKPDLLMAVWAANVLCH